MRDAAAEPTAPVSAPGAPGRPVVLATLGVPLDPAGERMAIDTAVETGARLVIVNVRVVPYAPMSTVLYGATLPSEEARDEVHASAERAAALGVRTLLLRVGTRRPVRALLEVTAEQSAGLLVFGPDRTAMRTRRFRRCARAIRSKADCLVWVTLDDPAGHPTA